MRLFIDRRSVVMGKMVVFEVDGSNIKRIKKTLIDNMFVLIRRSKIDTNTL